MQLEAEVNLITPAIKCAPGGATPYSFDVANLSDRAITVGLDSVGDTQGWVAFGPEQTELELPPRAIQRVTVKVAVPPNAQAKRYSFKLRVYDVRTPTRASESGAVAVEVVTGTVPPPPDVTPVPPTGGRNPWPLIIAAGVGGVVLIGALLTWILWPDAAPVPDLIGKTVAEAEELLAEAGYDPPQVDEEATNEVAPGLVVRQRPRPGADRPDDATVAIVIAAAAPATPRDAERLAARWVEAVNAKQVDALVAMAQPPFFMDNKLAVSTEDIRAGYVEMLKQMDAKVTVTRFDARTVGDFRVARLLDDRDRVISSMRIEDDDLAVAIFVGSEALIMFFRRQGPRLEMAGFWG